MTQGPVGISGMFGVGKSYFADSPVIIRIDGLSWPGYTEEITEAEAAKALLRQMFPNSNAPFNTKTGGYITEVMLGSNNYPIEDDNMVEHWPLLAKRYSKSGKVDAGKQYDLIQYSTMFFNEPVSNWMQYDRTGDFGIDHILIETDSSQERADRLIELCRTAYGNAEKLKSPFTIVRMEVLHDGAIVGDFRIDTGGQTETSFDISSALRAIWSEYDFSEEVAAANRLIRGGTMQEVSRPMRDYQLRIYTEYLASDGYFTTTQCEDEHGNTDIPGGQCLIGGLTEWERSLIEQKEDADVSHLEHTGVRNGDASTKPTSTPERVGRDSITSWIDVKEGYTKSIFYPADADPEEDDVIGRAQGWTGHAPIVLRDSVPYTDFLFVNRRGAVETCSAQMLEALSIPVETQTYSRSNGIAFKPSRSLLSISSGGRRSWTMSSGYQTRDWLEWWTMEFLCARQWWMLYKGVYIPVVVEPAKKEVSIFDRSKQQMQSVDFTVTLALEG